MHKHFLTLSDLNQKDFIDIFKITAYFKYGFGDPKYLATLLTGKTMGMIFEKPSTRTSISFAVGMYQLGGLPIILSAQDLQLHRGESIADTARVLSRYVNIVMIRANTHQSLIDFAAHADVPVINGLTDQEHPCQIISDLFTIYEKKIMHEHKNVKSNQEHLWENLSFKHLHITYVGDGNNVAHSWIHAAVKLGMKLTIACPEGFDPLDSIWEWGKQAAQGTGAIIEKKRDPLQAVNNADIIYTDVWTSMGKEKEKDLRKKIFLPYQVNQDLIVRAKKDVLIMHCMPAHRNEEITDEVIDGPRSIVVDEAENRLHVQKAIIIKLLKVPYE